MRIIHIAPISKRANGPTSVLIDLLKYQINFAKVALLSTFDTLDNGFLEELGFKNIKIIHFKKKKRPDLYSGWRPIH